MFIPSNILTYGYFIGNYQVNMLTYFIFIALSSIPMFLFSHVKPGWKRAQEQTYQAEIYLGLDAQAAGRLIGGFPGPVIYGVSTIHGCALSKRCMIYCIYIYYD
jgi:hypothetical protein